MLTYMATCRSADKKPHDNIPKEPTISQLTNNALSNAFGGGMTKKALNELVGRTQVLKEATGFLDAPAVKAANRMNDIVSSTSGAALKAATTTFMVEPLGLGKTLCPSVR